MCLPDLDGLGESFQHVLTEIGEIDGTPCRLESGGVGENAVWLREGLKSRGQMGNMAEGDCRYAAGCAEELAHHHLAACDTQSHSQLVTVFLGYGGYRAEDFQCRK